MELRCFLKCYIQVDNTTNINITKSILMQSLFQQYNIIFNQLMFYDMPINGVSRRICLLQHVCHEPGQEIVLPIIRDFLHIPLANYQTIYLNCHHLGVGLKQLATTQPIHTLSEISCTVK